MVNSETNIQQDIYFKSIPQFNKFEKMDPRNWSNIKTVKREKKNDPLVSIAISTYEANDNGVQLLSKAMHSINNQTYSNIEVVISDHSSNNKIKMFLKKFKKKYTVRYYHNPDMKGNSSHNTNNAINNCLGEYIKILFMDDYLYNNTIANIVDHFDKYPSKKWLVNSYEHIKIIKPILIIIDL